jgi:transcriptional regulator with XRE-family HTH domain
MKDLKGLIEKRIKEKGFTKDLISSHIGMERTGFYQALKKNNLSLEKLEKVMTILNIEPNYFFEWNNEIDLNQVNEPISEYGRKKNDIKIDTGVSEVDFLRSQVANLTKIIENLSRVIDSKNINN